MLVMSDFLPVVEKIKFTKEDDLSEFHYEDNVLFDRPLVVRGTKKQYIPYPSINRMQTLDEGTLPTIIASFKQVEDFDSVYLQSISNLNPISIKDEGFFFKVKVELTDRTEEKNLFVPFDKSTVAFKRLSTMLGIPYKFSLKNPGHLNEKNFGTWKDRICEEKHKDIPVCVIYSKSRTLEVTHESQIYTCNVVMTLLPVGTIKKADGSVSLIKKDISDQIPILHKILPTFVDGIKQELPGTKVILHSVATGYNGDNRGDHFAKFLLESPDMKWKIGEDEYMPTISLRSNFTGDDKKGMGETTIALSLIKLTCSNGAMITLPEEHLVGIRDQFVNKLLELNRIGKDHKDYQKHYLKYSKRFKKKFADFSCSISLHDLLTNFKNSDFISLLRVFMSCKDTVVQKSFEELKVPLGEIRDEDFVEVVETLSKRYKFKPDLTKAVILEYLASKQDCVVSFKDAYSIVNYITYLAQAYNSKVQSEIERKVVAFGLALTGALVHKAHYRIETLARYQGMIRQ